MVMVVAVMVGVLGTLILRLSSDQSKTQAQLAGKIVSDTTLEDIGRILLDVTSCTNTFKPLGAMNSNAATVLPLATIRNRSNAAAYNVGQKYGHAFVLLEKMELTGVTYSPSPIPAGQVAVGEGVLKVTLNRSKTGAFSMPARTFDIGIKFEFDSTKMVSKCFATVDDAVGNALAQFCASISVNASSYNPATLLCSLIGYSTPGSFRPTLPAQANTYAVSSAYLRQAMQAIESKYVNSEGDSMTGDLNIPNHDLAMVNLLTDLQICVGANCHKFLTTTCASNQIAYGLSNAGNLHCNAIDCPPNKYLLNITPGGAPNCQSFPTSSCPPNEYVVEILPGGSVRCEPVPSPKMAVCGPGYYMQGLDAASNPVCKPMMIDTNTNMYNKGCGGYFFRGATTAGVAICTQPCPCGACGATSPVAASCAAGFGTPINGTDTCVSSGWVRTVNPSCYCPCGTCGANSTVPASCSTGNPIPGTQQCRTTGWVLITAPTCQCSGCVCNTTRQITSGTTVINQICRTGGWVNY